MIFQKLGAGCNFLCKIWTPAKSRWELNIFSIQNELTVIVYFIFDSFLLCLDDNIFRLTRGRQAKAGRFRYVFLPSLFWYVLGRVEREGEPSSWAPAASFASTRQWHEGNNICVSQCWEWLKNYFFSGDKSKMCWEFLTFASTLLFNCFFFNEHKYFE